MRISDWSSDVCSSDLQAASCDAAFGYLALLETAIRTDPALGVTSFAYLVAQLAAGDVFEDQVDGATTAVEFTVTYKARTCDGAQIGRTTCRERVCQYV